MKLLTVLALLAVMGASQLACANQQQLRGVISDSMCGASHMLKDKTPAECTRICIKDGMKYALVVGEKVYTLMGHEAELDKLAGAKVLIRGDVSGTTVKIASVQPAGN